MEEIRRTLIEKLEMSEQIKGRSTNKIEEEFHRFIEDLNEIEADLLNAVDRSFDNSIFSSALALLDNNNESPEAQAQVRSITEVSVPLLMGPTNQTLEIVRQAISALKDSIPPSPRNFEGRPLTYDTVELSWGNSLGAAKYQVEVRAESDGKFLKAYELTSNKLVMDGLCQGTTYKARVRTLYGSGFMSKWSDEVDVEVLKVPVPSNITVEVRSWDTISICWDPASEGLSYKVKYAEVLSPALNPYIVDVLQKTRLTTRGLQQDRNTAFGFRQAKGTHGASGVML